ncbi:hypothetical protein LRS10_13865 [Phenylobacterium sp. J426]|uniref:hypothetical protein n=1 Tax=Phenylobacterium sp. J426 TaxID=2898439 RepID=UPI0021511F9A|nr:hypothetical protein [Phenylobacterium sp. J426]MCR5875180.1 hypothetical protein [Phenylobacterium sp. J426]
MIERFRYAPLGLWAAVTVGFIFLVAERASHTFVASSSLAWVLAASGGLCLKVGFVRRAPFYWGVGIVCVVLVAKMGTVAGMDLPIALWLLLGVFLAWLPSPPAGALEQD